MRRALGLWFLAAVAAACSGGTESGPEPETGGSAGVAGRAPDPAAGASSGIAGRDPAGGSGGTLGLAGGAGDVSEPGEAGAGAGEAGTRAEAGAGQGGAPDEGAAGAPSSGSAGTPSQGGGSAGGSGGTAGGAGGSVGTGGGPPDACIGYAPWSAQERWTDYEANERRVFAGALWRCAVPSECPTYPGHAVSPGWFKVENCAGGPTNETAPCQCSSGTCCDGCYLRPRSYLCGEVVRTAQCLGKVVNQCGGALETIDKDWWNLFCNGDQAATCTRWGAHTKYSSGACGAGTGCVETGDQASCMTCGG